MKAIGNRHPAAVVALLLLPFYFALLGAMPEADGPPEIIGIAPLWGASGSVLSLTIQGRNLHKASEVRFYPSTGIAIDEDPIVNGEGTIVTVKVTILVHAPLGARLVAVRTPAGQSSLTPTEANTFKVSYAHMN